MPNRGRDSCSRHLGQSGSTVLQRKAIGHDFAEIVAIERFWRRALEEGSVRNRATCAAEALSGAGERTADVGCGTGMPPYPIVDQRIAGPGVEGEDFAHPRRSR